jgi:hypothetical protein
MLSCIAAKLLDIDAVTAVRMIREARRAFDTAEQEQFVGVYLRSLKSVR